MTSSLTSPTTVLPRPFTTRKIPGHAPRGRGHHILPAPKADPPEGSGVRELLERDRKIRQLPQNIPQDLQDAGPIIGKVNDNEDSTPPLSPAPAGAQARVARTQTIEAEEETPPSDEDDGPKTSNAAIVAGIEQLNQQNPKAAVALFQRALELPGKGAFRMKGSPREYSCASEGEEMAALYNLACAYAALKQTDAALASLEGAFEAGFEDFETCRNDPDLQSLQGPKLEQLIQQRERPSGRGSFLSNLSSLWKR